MSTSSSTGATTGAATGPEHRRADVELRLPADSAYASVLRTTTAGLAARLDFSIDDIEDLRIAVSEASAMVLPRAVADSDLTCLFYLAPGLLTVSVGVRVDAAVTVDEDSFAWQVLTTLASSASVESDDNTFTVLVTMDSAAQAATL